MSAARLPPYAQGLRVLFGLLLAITGLAKLADMPGFIDVVAAYQTLPTFLLPFSAWTLALAEVALALWLVSGWRLGSAAVAVVALHLMYLGWLTQALWRGLDIRNCGCFGVYLARPLQPSTLVEDMVLLVLASMMLRGIVGATPSSS